MTPADRNRLVAILGRLGSDFDGERAAAGLLASRIIKGNNLTWDDIVLPVALSHDDTARSRPPTWRADVQLCQRYTGGLRPWERGFIAPVAAQPRLTAKQLATLREIASKLRARGAT